MKGFIILLFISLPFASVAQEVPAITGIVMANKEPLPYINIAVLPTSKGTTSDSLGRFSIASIPSGNYTIRFSGIGYTTANKKVTVVSNQSLKLNVEMNEDVNQLNEVVITGTLKEMTRSESPISIEVYAPTLFRKNPTPNIFESLSIVNGVQPQINCNVCNTGDIHINGLEGPYTMILIDGMPIVSSLSTVYGLSGIPNSMVKRIEVVKGPASTLYGSEAVGGVINIITKDPLTSDRLMIDAFATSVGEYNVDLSSTLKMKKATSLLGINYFNYTQPRDINDDNFTDVTLQKRVSVFNKWNLARKSGKHASFALRYVNENRWGGELQWKEEHRGTDIYYGESITTNRIEMIGNYQPVGNEHFNIDYSYNYHLQDSYYGTVKYLARQHVAFTQLRWAQQFGKHDLLGGLPFRYIHYDDNTAGTATFDGSNKPGTTVLPGLFVQDEIKFTQKFTTLLGARYDHHNIHGSVFTERISFKVSPNKMNTFRLTAGSGFRVVNLFTEEHAALTGARQVELKSNLKPEQSWNVNFNYSKLITHNNGYVSLDASLFYTYFTNKIVGDFITDPDKIIFDNLEGHAVSKGITFNSDFSFANSLKLMAGVTLMDVYRYDYSVSESKIPQIQAPTFSGTFNISYAFDQPRLSVDLTGKVNGPMHLPVVPNDFRPELSPWLGLVNIQLTKAIGEGWEVYGGVKNLLNFIPDDPLLRPFDPFDKNINVNNPNGYTFDTSYNYAPLQGTRGFLGVRYRMK